MNPTETAALISSAATVVAAVVAALGTQALNNRRESERRKAEVDQARIEETRQLYEQAAVAIHHALNLLGAARPEPQRAYNPENVEDVATSVDGVDLIQTRLDVHVPWVERDIGPWRNILSALSKTRKGLHDTLDQVRGLAGQTPTDKQVAMFNDALKEADRGSASFRDSVANAFRVSVNLHWTFRERLTRRRRRRKTKIVDHSRPEAVDQRRRASGRSETTRPSRPGGRSGPPNGVPALCGSARDACAIVDPYTGATA